MGGLSSRVAIVVVRCGARWWSGTGEGVWLWGYVVDGV